MIPCHHCGQLNDRAARVCRYCGTSLSPQPQPQATERPGSFTPPPPYGWAQGSGPLPAAQGYTPPPAPAPQPYAAPQATAGYKCPRCGSGYLPIVEKKISSDGWVIFILLLFFCVPLCWIGLLIKQESRVCPVCHAQLG
jgi:RNA polymerase subunit RPABC4/transcription elongation factor Spt4